MNEIDKSITQRVKDKLGVSTDNVLELFKLLRTARAGKHPDNYSDEAAKKTARDEFVELSNLYTELDAFIQQRQASMMPVLADGNNEVAEFYHLREADVKDAEIAGLKQKISDLKFRLEHEQEVNDRLHKNIKELSKQRVENIHEEIRSIYSPRKAWTNIGLVAILASLTATFPIAKDFLQQIGATSGIAMLAIRTLAVVTIFNWVRSWAVNKVVENIEYGILNDRFINFHLNITKRETGSIYPEYAFNESDIVAYIEKQLTKYHRILLWGGYNKTVKILTEDIILQLDRKNLIKSTRADGLNKIFVVERNTKAAAADSIF